MKRGRSAIALLITLMFVIVITVAIGYGLKQVNTATEIVKSENFFYQRDIIIEDILNLLSSSQMLQSAIENSDTFYLFLSEASFIPLELEGIEVLLKIKSARSKFNPAMLDTNTSIILKQYLTRYSVNAQYVDILLDNIRGIKEDNSYNSTIFDENPYLFRDYIASSKHLEIINDYYTKEYNDNALKNIDFNELFYYSKDRNITIDLNYATTQVWELLLGCSQQRAETLNAGGGFYTDLESLNLNDDEKEILTRNFKTSFFEPIVQIELDIRQNKQHSKVTFEYDIQNKKGSNFAYEI